MRSPTTSPSVRATCFNEAEAMGPGMVAGTFTIRKLQRGRGTSASDGILPAITTTLISRTFNEAEAHTPRILRIYRRDEKGKVVLQCGRGASAPDRLDMARGRDGGLGSPELKDGQRHLRRASMRPRRVRLGYFSPIPWTRLIQRCFNEAEAGAPRMRPPHWAMSTRPTSFNEADGLAPWIPYSRFQRAIGLRSRNQDEGSIT
jgi:hypothetical protein